MKKEVAIAFFQVVLGFFSTIVMMHYYFSFFVISRILKGLGIDSLNIISIEDIMFPVATINELAFSIILLLVVAIVIFAYAMNQVYSEKKNRIKEKYGECINNIVSKYWFLIALVLIIIICTFSYLVDDRYKLILFFAVSLFIIFDITRLRNCLIILGIYVCSLHLLYDVVLKACPQETSESSSFIIIKTQDGQIFRTDTDWIIVFWGAKYVILKNLISNQVELIPTTEIKHIQKKKINRDSHINSYLNGLSNIKLDSLFFNKEETSN